MGPSVRWGNALRAAQGLGIRSGAGQPPQHGRASRKAESQGAQVESARYISEAHGWHVARQRLLSHALAVARPGLHAAVYPPLPVLFGLLVCHQPCKTWSMLKSVASPRPQTWQMIPVARSFAHIPATLHLELPLLATQREEGFVPLPRWASLSATLLGRRRAVAPLRRCSAILWDYMQVWIRASEATAGWAPTAPWTQGGQGLLAMKAAPETQRVLQQDPAEQGLSAALRQRHVSSHRPPSQLSNGDVAFGWPRFEGIWGRTEHLKMPLPVWSP
mmetsp:Transcript_10717/g.23596  ORF Transcript_10717/g.23596 Transcript_10717/m.23596 type:complete len:275 (-) Transcript_10717:606-1430(-)